MDTITLRRKNLRKIIDQQIEAKKVANDAAFCELYDLNTSHISQLVKGHGSFGERAARNLERKIGLSEHALDEPDLTSNAFDNNVLPANFPLRRIPLLDFVQAGLWREVVYDGLNPKGYSYTSYEGKRPEEVFSLHVEGLSMAPEFGEGDEIVVDPSIAPSPGDFVVAQNGNYETTFKKYRVTGYDEFGREIFELIPLNPDFPVLRSEIQPIGILGVVVAHTKKFR